MNWAIYEHGVLVEGGFSSRGAAELYRDDNYRAGALVAPQKRSSNVLSIAEELAHQGQDLGFKEPA